MTHFAFREALKGKPAGHVVVWFADADEPRQFAWQLGVVLKHSPGWSVDIKPLKDKYPDRAIEPYGTIVNCPAQDNEANWLDDPKTMCGTLRKALTYGTETGGPSGFVVWVDPNLDHLEIEVWPQLTAKDINKQK